MPRFLLATEGPVDEVVLRALCAEWSELTAADIDVKQFPARGGKNLVPPPSLAALHLALTQIRS